MRLIDRALLRASRRPEDRGEAAHRRDMLASATGVVVELGAGAGATFAHYPAAVSRVIAVEPAEPLRERAAEVAAGAKVPIEVVPGRAEAIPVADHTADTVVASLVLCSVDDLDAVVREISRVLVPHGRVLFYEHVRAAGARGGLERAATPLWSRIAGGCHLDRDPVAAFERAGYRVTHRRMRFAPVRGLPGVDHVIAAATRG